MDKDLLAKKVKNYANSCIQLVCLLGFLLFQTSCNYFSSYQIPILSPEYQEFGLTPSYSIGSPHFERVIGHLLGPQIVEGNQVRTLVNGDRIFPAMLSAINRAEHSITLETYIYWEGEIGRKFTEALSERARAGVKVHVLVDWYGSDLIEQAYLGQMKDAGVDFKVYNPPNIFNPFAIFNFQAANYRTHRKIMVIDGRTAFIGGVGIADLWAGDAQDENHWRDTHYQVEGPVVAQIQSEFLDNWLEQGGRLLDDEIYFPELTRKGTTRVQAFKSSPYEATAHLELMFRIALTAARKSIKIGTAYFVPDEGTRQALIDSVNRGVEVEIIVPGKHIDQELVRLGSRSLWGELLKAGVKIYEYQPSMYHTKLLIVDDYYCSIGSANFDNRSFHLNDEANLNVFDEKFAAEQTMTFNQDRSKSQLVTYEHWLNRPVLERIGNLMGWLTRGML